MAITFTDIAKVAGSLARQRTEAAFRSAVSRYYYSAFTLVVELHSPKTHRTLSHMSAQKTVERVAGWPATSNMIHLYEARKQADYDTQDRIKVDWKVELEEAKRKHRDLVTALLDVKPRP